MKTCAEIMTNQVTSVCFPWGLSWWSDGRLVRPGLHESTRSVESGAEGDIPSIAVFLREISAAPLPAMLDYCAVPRQVVPGFWKLDDKPKAHITGRTAG